MNTNRNVCLHFVVGLDLAQGREPTAVAVIEREARYRRVDTSLHSNGEVHTAALRVRHLEQLPGLSLPQVITRARAMVDMLATDEQDHHGTDVIVGINDTGKAVLPYFHERQLQPTLVTITAGGGETEIERHEWRVSKTELVNATRLQLQLEVLKIAAALEHAETLRKELLGFKMRPPRVNEADLDAWREGQHDGLVFAVSLAVWKALRSSPIPQAVRDRWNRAMAEHSRRMQVMFNPGSTVGNW